MKLMSLANLINFSFQYVTKTSELYNIDESHSFRHSMDVFHYASEIYNHCIYTSPFLKEQQKIIFTSAILHDMCDKKYMDEKEGIQNLRNYMSDVLTIEELDIISKIISTMSYSTVKKNGYPNDLGIYNLAYHIVREADLLSAYDIERCIIYQVKHENYNYLNSFTEVEKIFKNRVFNYIDDGLFITEYSKKKSRELHYNSLFKLIELEKKYKSMII
jgi:HD superfamily phosphodiesterase